MGIAVVRRAAVTLFPAIFVASAATCSTAVALEPGVHVDPSSPAAKEYALPLDQARQTGQQEGSARSRSSGALFGAGISPARSRLGPASDGRHGRKPRQGDHGATAVKPTAPALAARGVLARQGSSHGGAGSILALLGGGVLVLVLGAFLGVVLRGHRAAHPS